MGTALQSTRSDRVELPVLTNMKIGNSPGNSVSYLRMPDDPPPARERS